MPKAGIEIQADLKALRATLNEAVSQFKELNKTAIGAATGIKTIEDSAKKASVASRALGVALGMLGVNSITSVVYKITGLVKQAVTLAMNLQAVENRARAVFGSAFPEMQKAAAALGEQFKRSASDIMELQTGFALIMDSAGLSEKQINKYSKELSALAVTIQKAFPSMSAEEVFSKLEAGIMGSNKALKALSITVTDDLLQSFLTGQGIKKKLKDMDTEEKMMVRINYLLSQTGTLQEAAARATGQMADQIATQKAAIKDFLESAGGRLIEWTAILIQNINAARVGIRDFLANLVLAVSRGQALRGAPGARNVNGIIDYTMPGYESLRTMAPQEDGAGAEETLAEYLKRHKSSVGGGGGGKSLADKLKDAEKAMFDALTKQAEKGLEIMKQRREELLLRQKMGVITKAETAELGRINNRVAFQKDAIEDATKAWEEQVEKIKEVKDRIAELQAELDKEKATPASMEADTVEAKTQKYMELFKELQDINDEIESMSGRGTRFMEWDPEKYASDVKRKADIEAMLDKVRQGKGGNEIAGEAGRRLGLDDIEQIDDEAKRAEDERVKRLEEEIDAQNKTLTNLQKVEQQKKQAVLNALADQAKEAAPYYALLEQQLRDHVNTQIGYYNGLAAAIRNSAKGVDTGLVEPPEVAPQFATGGTVFGPSGKDKVLAWLTAGEEVINKRASSMFRPVLKMMNSMTLPRFATGGTVTNSHSDTRNANITVHNHGEAARWYADPLMQRWRARTMLG